MRRILSRGIISAAAGLLVLASAVAGAEFAWAQSTLPPAPVPPRDSTPEAGSIRVTCSKIEGSTAVRAIDIWVSYTGQGKDVKLKNMVVVWTLPDGSAVDRAAQYSRNLGYQVSAGWGWSGEEPGTTHTMDGILIWITVDLTTGQPVKGRWRYSEEYWPTSKSRAGREITVAEGCTGTDGDNLQ